MRARYEQGDNDINVSATRAFKYLFLTEIRLKGHKPFFFVISVENFNFKTHIFDI